MAWPGVVDSTASRKRRVGMVLFTIIFASTLIGDFMGGRGVFQLLVPSLGSPGQTSSDGSGNDEDISSEVSFIAPGSSPSGPGGAEMAHLFKKKSALSSEASNIMDSGEKLENWVMGHHQSGGGGGYHTAAGHSSEIGNIFSGSNKMEKTLFTHKKHNGYGWHSRNSEVKAIIPKEQIAHTMSGHHYTVSSSQVANEVVGGAAASGSHSSDINNIFG